MAPLREPARPRIAITVGDPSGIGPEVAAAAWSDPAVREELDLVVVGPASLRPSEIPLAVAGAGVSDLAWLATEAPDSWEMGRAQATCGRAALAALRAGADLATRGVVDALVTAPVCKEALHLAGEEVEGQTELLARWAGVARHEMIGIAGDLRVMLLSRHVALRAAVSSVSRAAVVDHLALFDETLRSLGIERPRLAVAGLNPHASEGGLFGDEEREHLSPAVADARALGLAVDGPLPADTVFLEASRGRFDGVLALYHDQAFIPLKLLSADRGLTLIAGLPYVRVSPVHGTAFDIAGKGVARAENMVHAVRQAGRWAAIRSQVRA